MPGRCASPGRQQGPAGSERARTLDLPAICVLYRLKWRARCCVPQLGGIFGDDREGLDDFDLVSLDANSHGSLNCIDGYDKRVISGAGLKNSFYAVESATAETHALADFEKRMTATRDVLGKKNSN